MNSCKKETSELLQSISPQNAESNLFARESTVSDSAIYDWLDRQKSDSTPNKNEVINSILENLDYENKWTELLTDGEEGENIVVLPLSENFISRHNGNLNPIQTLVLFEDGNGEIQRGNIYQFIPENNYQGNFIPVGMISKLLLEEVELPHDGRVAVLTIADFFLSEVLISGNAIVGGNNINFEDDLEQDCVHWVHVFYTVYADGHYEIDEVVDLGCMSCPPNELCDEIETIGGGGVSGPFAGDPINELVDFTVATGPSLTVMSFEKAIGNRHPSNDYLNSFIRLEHLSSAVINSHPDVNGAPWSTWVQTANACNVLGLHRDRAESRTGGILTSYTGAQQFLSNHYMWFASNVF